MEFKRDFSDAGEAPASGNERASAEDSGSTARVCHRVALSLCHFVTLSLCHLVTASGPDPERVGVFAPAGGLADGIEDHGDFGVLGEKAARTGFGGGVFDDVVLVA